ncbi:hypothetical protein [Caulobacter sp.]|uniref:hypothetical protein n=1 Tax=Caulobacter sp. TaxID=78 RepID=UPI003BAF2C02
MAQQTLNIRDVVIPLEFEVRSGALSLGTASIEGLTLRDATGLAAAVVAGLTERVRQMTVKGMTANADDEYTHGQLAEGAQAYLAAALILNAPATAGGVMGAISGWPNEWHPDAFRPFDSDGGGRVADQLRCLDKAVAMILAERQRVVRDAQAEQALAAQERRDSGR